MAASLGSLRELRHVSVPGGSPSGVVPLKPPRPRLMSPSLRQFSALRAVTVLAVNEQREGCLPALPASLQALTLDGIVLNTTPEPSWQQSLAHLTRLTELTLQGYRFRRRKFFWRDDRQPLPVSLRTLRLDTSATDERFRGQVSNFTEHGCIDLGALTTGNTTFQLSDGALLIASCCTACCNLDKAPVAAAYAAGVVLARARDDVVNAQYMAGTKTHSAPAIPRNAADAFAALAAKVQTPAGPVSGLPGGFAALEMHVSQIRLAHSMAPAVPTVNDAAQEMCLFFGRAPASYRRFRVFWHPTRPLQFEFAWHVVPQRAGYADATFNSVHALAQCMQDYAGAHNLSIAVAEEPAPHLLIIRY